MEITTVTIQRKLAIINGFVSIPDDQRLLKTSLTPEAAIAALEAAGVTGSRIMKVTSNGINPTITSDSQTGIFSIDGPHIEDQLWLELPALNARTDNIDLFQILRNAASA